MNVLVKLLITCLGVYLTLLTSLFAQDRLVLTDGVIPPGKATASVNLVLQNQVPVAGLLIGLQYDSRLRVDSVRAVGKGIVFSDLAFNQTKTGQGILLGFDKNGANIVADSSPVATIWFTAIDSVLTLSYPIGFGETQIAANSQQLITYSKITGKITRGFTRGNLNHDSALNVADIVYLINYIFVDGPAPDPLPDADVNCDNYVNVADAVYLINYIFGNGGVPCLK